MGLVDVLLGLSGVVVGPEQILVHFFQVMSLVVNVCINLSGDLIDGLHRLLHVV